MIKAYRVLPALLAAAVLTAAPACASRGSLYRYPSAGRASDDRAYRNGFDEGRQQGANDARRGRSFDYSRHDEYRDADQGYRNANISRNEYRQVFRQGFVDGYNEAYRQYDRNRRGASTYPGRGPVFGGQYPQQNPRYGYRSPAADNGFRDGYDQGRSDARDGDRYDPVRAKRYREGDHDYNNRYGSRDEYKREYRSAFEQGYSQGYREIRRR